MNCSSLKKTLGFLSSIIFRRKIVSSKGRPNVNSFCWFGAQTLVGHNVNFNGVRTYGAGKVCIGDNFHSGTGLIILTQNHNYHGDTIPYDKSVVIKDVVIDDNVWIGINVMILPGVKIGEGAIIQAGSVVSKSIPDLAIAGGNPAVVFRYRNEAHYFELKGNGKIL